jgi:hypothetical protein
MKQVSEKRIEDCNEFLEVLGKHHKRLGWKTSQRCKRSVTPSDKNMGGWRIV